MSHIARHLGISESIDKKKEPFKIRDNVKEPKCSSGSFESNNVSLKQSWSGKNFKNG